MSRIWSGSNAIAFANCVSTNALCQLVLAVLSALSPQSCCRRMVSAPNDEAPGCAFLFHTTSRQADAATGVTSGATSFAQRLIRIARSVNHRNGHGFGDDIMPLPVGEADQIVRPISQQNRCRGQRCEAVPSCCVSGLCRTPPPVRSPGYGAGWRQDDRPRQAANAAGPCRPQLQRVCGLTSHQIVKAELAVRHVGKMKMAFMGRIEGPPNSPTAAACHPGTGVEPCAGEDDPVHPSRSWPSPLTRCLKLVSCAAPTGPRACMRPVAMPISAPMPNSPPSANWVEALTITMALSTSRRKVSAVAAFSVMIQSV